MLSNKVIVIGSLNYDINIHQERMPKKGEVVTGISCTESSGGKGSNQAAICAKLGLDTTMVGCVGTDSFGNILKTSLKKAGVNTKYIKEKGSTGLGIVHVMPDGDYYSTLVKGANYLINKKDIDDILPLLRQSNYLLLQQEIPEEILTYIIEKIENEKISVILNNAPDKKISSNILKRLDYLIVNETEASFMSNTTITTIDEAIYAGKILKSQMNGNLIITLGENGSIAFYNDCIFKCNPIKVKAIDASGAGDCYIGSFVYCLSQKMSIPDAMQFASKASALAVSKNGVQEAFPTLDDILNFSM